MSALVLQFAPLAAAVPNGDARGETTGVSTTVVATSADTTTSGAVFTTVQGGHDRRGLGG